MIHHFARALAIREQTRSKPDTAAQPVLATGRHVALMEHGNTRAVSTLSGRGLRMRRDPSDARRAVITGRFADVCAALDRMVAELEPASA